MTTAVSQQHVSALSMTAPMVAILVFSIGIAWQLGLTGSYNPLPAVEQPATVTIPAHRFEFRADGEFFKNGFAVDAPIVEGRMSSPLTVMKYQVTEGEYARCIDAGECAAPERKHVHGLDRPVTGVSYDDALTYASWLSDRTGEVWSLPTHEQLAAAAGTKFPDDALGVDADSRNPAIRWLADYERETRRKAASDPTPKAIGHFGENEYGLADFAGNIWEWTSTCQRRIDLAAEGSAASTISTCGIYVTVGQHRSPMSAFVRDPKTGGCSVGAPPSNLGFRLVRDDRWYALIVKRLKDRGIL